MNIIVWLDFELAYYDAAVHHVSHYTMGIPLPTWERYESKFSLFFMAYQPLLFIKCFYIYIKYRICKHIM